MYARNHSLPSAPSAPILLLGTVTFRGVSRRFGLLPADRLRHCWIMGKTGSGKSTLLSRLIAQDLAAGRGLALLDPHGDLVDQTLAHVPPHRTNDVLLFSPEDREWPISFNVFRQGRHPHPDPALLTSYLISVFKRQWADSWGPRLEHVLRNAILAVAAHPDATLHLVYDILVDRRRREQVLSRVTDPVVLTFWRQEFVGYSPRLQSDALSPVLNKLGAFLANPVVRHIVSQVRSRVDLVSHMERSGIVLARLPAAQIGDDASRLLGGLLLTTLQLSAMSRGRSTPPFYCYLDEFQYFASDSLATLLAESRKFGLGLVLAHQYLAQLPTTLRDAVIGNAGTRVLFGMGADDARRLSGEFEPTLNAHDLQRLRRHHMAIALTAHGQMLSPFIGRSLGPLARPADATRRCARIRAQSRARYGRKTPRGGALSAPAASL